MPGSTKDKEIQTIKVITTNTEIKILRKLKKFFSELSRGTSEPLNSPSEIRETQE